MRWLFLFVLSLNLAYFGWQSSQVSSTDYDDVPALRNVEPIVLLSELKQQEDSVKVEQLAESPVGDVPVKQLDVQQVVEPFQQVDEIAAESEDEPEDEKALAVAPKTVAVLEESAAEEMLPLKSAPAVPAPVEPVPVEPKLIEKGPIEHESMEVAQQASCYTMGPFRNLGKLRALIREIKSYVVSADFRGREEKEQTLYWVYVHPEKTRKKAVETGRRLKAKKIKDFYVIREGDKIHGLSLGHFRSKSGAYGLAKKVKKLGFAVSVEPIFKSYTVYWLDYQLAEGVSIPESSLDLYIKKGKINRLSRACAE